MMNRTIAKTTLKKGHDYRIRLGHPWVFANELENVQRIHPGGLVHLQDSRGEFLGVGYGNPQSQIVVRILSRQPTEINSEFFYHRLRNAWNQRERLGLVSGSFRWIFAEADLLPGLIVDRYLTLNSQSQVFVAQISTKGMESLWPDILLAMQKIASELELNTSIVLDRSPSSRNAEGLEVLKKEVIENPGQLDLSNCVVLIGSHFLKQPAKISANFIDGQKTGLFLDQSWNQSILVRTPRVFEKEKIRVLDMCSYVGQWGSVLGQSLDADVSRLEVTCVDISASALEFAKTNIERTGASCIVLCQDALKAELPNEKYDLVLCDPPAFVKNKKDFDKGKAAYVKLFREAMRRVRPKGLLVAASCSGLVSSIDFREILSMSESKSEASFSWYMQGGHGPDHPSIAGFPQGTYLKCSFGIRQN